MTAPTGVHDQLESAFTIRWNERSRSTGISVHVPLEHAATVHPHMLRRATGYALANEGTDTRLTQDFLGRASITNTVRYTRLAPGRLAAVRVR